MNACFVSKIFWLFSNCRVMLFNSIFAFVCSEDAEECAILICSSFVSNWFISLTHFWESPILEGIFTKFNSLFAKPNPSKASAIAEFTSIYSFVDIFSSVVSIKNGFKISHFVFFRKSWKYKSILFISLSPSNNFAVKTTLLLLKYSSLITSISQNGKLNTSRL